jgi:gamma-glutamyltranspeptidase/glutathione hydrolase
MPAAGTRGMVATAAGEASRVGAELLRAGGNAVDAAVGAAFVLAVVEPWSSGIGGGGFALVRFDDGVAFLDFREVAPAAATETMFLRDGRPDPLLSRDGPLAVAVPGAVAGYLALHERYGRLPRARVLEPAIRLAREGFPVNERYRRLASWRREVLAADPEAARIFLVDGEVPPLGHRVVQPDLADTLRAIAEEGAGAFYTGPIGKRLAADVAERGGILTAEDLAGYRPRWREPLEGRFRGHRVITAPLPSSGGVILLSLLAAREAIAPGTPRHHPAALHVELEAAKRAYADRALLGDPDFLKADPTSALLAPGRWADLVAGFGEARAASAERVRPGEGTQLAAAPPAAPPGGDDTSHLSVVDAAGNAVSLTTTVNYAWGAGIVAGGTGVLLNDEMDDFSIAPGVPNVYGVPGSRANAVAPGKVPLSSMAPTLVLDGAGRLRLVVGSPGGSRIPAIVAAAIVNHLDHGADVWTALALGRVHHQHRPDVTFVEPFALEPATATALRIRGHVLRETEPWGNATAVAIDPDTGVRTGAADPRGAGAAVAEDASGKGSPLRGAEGGATPAPSPGREARAGKPEAGAAVARGRR